MHLYVPLAVLISLYPDDDNDDGCGCCSTGVFGCVLGPFGCALGTLFVIGLALLGWSSFEFDTIQGND